MAHRRKNEVGRPRIVIVLNADQDVVAWQEKYRRGEVLDATPYGYDRAESDAELFWARSAAESDRMRRLRVSAAGRLGFDLVHVWRNRRLIRTADVIWTHTEREHLAVAMLQALRRPSRRVPVLAQSVWLWDAWATWPWWRRRLVARLLRVHGFEAVHSAVNREISDVAVPGRRVAVLPFGSASPFDRSAAESLPVTPPLVLAVGNDADRDWATLAEAGARAPGVYLRVASTSRRARSISWPANTTVAPADSRADLVALYSAASVIVVPLRENKHASGATACIEALGAGRPLIVTEAGGIESYVSGAACLVPPADARALATAILAAAEGGVPAPPKDAAERRGLGQADYVARYMLVTHWLLGSQGWDESISAFAPIATADDAGRGTASP